MKKFFQKKQWMTVSLVAALGVAVYLNYYFTQETTLSATGSSNVSGSTSSTEEDDTLGDAVLVGTTVSDVNKEETEPSGGTVTSTPEDTADSTDYFKAARASRTAAREESVRLLDELLGNPQTDGQEKVSATEQASAIAANILQESNIENLILAKGFSDCVVFISGDTCQIIVDAPQLQALESAQILEIVQLQTDIPAKNVKISTAQT